MSPEPVQAACPPSETILVAEDDEEDRLLMRDAFSEAKVNNDVRFVDDGEALLDYLLHRNAFSEPDSAPLPGLILLDLNMPRKDGREALREIKAHPLLRKIPVVVLTTSRNDEDVVSSYESGVNSFIIKPGSFARLVELVVTLSTYWFKNVTLPKVQ